MKLRLTVLTLAVLLLLTVLPGMTVFAVPYEQAQVTGSVEFENAREENIGTEGSDIIGPFEPHGFWEMTEGTVTVTPGHNGNGLLFTPNYSNEQGYDKSVMRAWMPALENKELWGRAAAMRFYVKNDTEYDVSVAFVVNVDGQNGEKYVIGPAEGTYLIDLQGEVSDMEAYTDTSGCGILVPYGFEGYVVLPFAVKGGEVFDDECGWQDFPLWSDDKQTPESADSFDFGRITKVSMEIRLYGFAPEDKGGIMIDSFEFIGERGNAVERPEHVNVNVTPLPEQSAPVAENSASPAPTGTASSQPQQKNGSVWIITAACVCAAAVAAVCIVMALKKRGGKKA